ncbi:MAG: DUF2442 domain-containing protein [Planctomycetales bacterium]|nr:DUF2442 domain-containing protein [Planctomycetales bacterium]NIP86132.1 DUF2442 domain-containing protein [Planctomycetales bacterium]
MFPRVAEVQYKEDYQLRVKFTDGTTADLDLRPRIVGRGGVFQPLEEVDYFAQVAVDHEAGTLVWPNGVDLCPDVLYAEATGRDVAELRQDLELT